jgi:Xaa-Pro aminopeptidase
MTAAADLMSEILSAVISKLKPGKKEKEIAWEIEGLAREGGADGLAFSSIVASGPNSALPHAVPTDRKVRAKEPITFDVGVKIDGYSCDMTRTVFLGEPTPKFKKIYKTVRTAQLASLKQIRPGVKSTVPDLTARKSRDTGLVITSTLSRPRVVCTGPRLGRKTSCAQARMVVTDNRGSTFPDWEKSGSKKWYSSAARVLTKDDHFYDFES